MNRGFPLMEGFPFITYLHLGKVGLVVFDGLRPRMIHLPPGFPENRSSPFVIWDGYAGKFYAIRRRAANTLAEEDPVPQAMDVRWSGRAGPNAKLSVASTRILE